MRGLHRIFRTGLHGLQVVVLFTLVGAAATQTWSVISFEIEATDGAPTGFREGCCTPFSFNTELNISQEDASTTLGLSGLTSLLNWNDQRIYAEEREENDVESNVTEGESNFNLSDVQQGLPIAVKIVGVFSIVVLALYFFEVRFRIFFGILLNLCVLLLVVGFIVMPPLGWFASFDINEAAFGEEDGDRQDSLAHSTFENKFDFSNENLSFMFTTGGYDLAMVNETDSASINASSPGKEHMSYVEFEGVFVVEFTPLIQDLLLIWFVLFTLLPISLLVVERAAIDPPVLLDGDFIEEE